ncbi:MAG: DUF4215 domain-containing protein [Kofleriaceae bacterium]|nr:DUF4215 domain-containing protein [Kofleriaceae bacterium]MCB9572397.1 DUF4215 domain-containing protein [Kofleriaceae bacterium]
MSRAGLTVAALALGGAALIGAGSVSCGGGGDAVCGNGLVEDGEQCDDGNADETDYCQQCVVVLPPRTTIKWRFNAEAAPGFSQDSCTDLGVLNVRVDLDGPTTASAEALCPTFQVVFEDLPPGPYQASVFPLDGNEEPLVVAPAQAQVTAEAVDTEHTINVTPDLWTGPYTGAFFFNLKWQGAPCTTAAPPVAQQVLTLTIGGVVVTQLTEQGQKLDGTDPKPCIAPGSPSQSVLALPFGMATITVVGRDAGGVEAFRGSFETFIGAGPSNPTIEFDVPTVYDAMPADAEPPDAGVDAM